MSHWFKFYGSDYLTDPKMLSLTLAERCLWLGLLCLASNNSNGTVTHITEERLLSMHGISPADEEWNKSIGFFKKFSDLEMIDILEKGIHIKNFVKRQETALTNAERQARYRESRKQFDTNATNSNEKVTGRITKVTLDKNRIEKNRKEYIAPEADAANNVAKPLISVESDSKDAAKVISAFECVDPMFARNFKNKTQRASAERLVKKLGLEETLKLVSSLPQIVSRPYAPKITNSWEMEQNLGKLIAFIGQENGKNKSGVEVMLRKK